ncbi:MAG: sigma-54 dependent transcriptional regulator, partial [Thermodesulfobacteriota bacterium]|nr:sigma-54 dependent transcriptional regulator [Thermodesulfobacteriota bacterium]
MSSLLVASDRQDVFTAIKDCLKGKFHIDQAINGDAASKMACKNHYKLIFFDIEILPEFEKENNYKDTLGLFSNLRVTSELVALSPKEKIREAVKAIRAGATDYIPYPIVPEEVKSVIQNIYEDIAGRRELDYLQDRFWQSDSLEIVNTRNSEMQGVFDKIRLVAPTKSSILLTGETGTGKGVLARLIHRHSIRRDEQFINIHCGAIPDTLLESELFGHEKGAFTDAAQKKRGKFEMADGGTLFLDEIGTLTPSAQVKLLQVVQDGTFQRVGGEKAISVDARLISATNADLKKMCHEGRFRKDLYYRLNVFPIEIPPLRRRTEDIPHLTNLFLKWLNTNERKDIHSVAQDVIEFFKAYSWPGNVREMENILEHAYIMETSHVLTAKNLPPEIGLNGKHPSAACPDVVDHSMPIAELRRRVVDEAEKNYLNTLLFICKGKLKQAAEIAGIST